MRIKRKIFNGFIILLTLLLVSSPLLFYFLNITGSFSHKNEDWGDFGSFVGGVYGSIFSSVTLLVVLWSAYKTNKSSNEQLAILRNERNFNEFTELLNHLKNNYRTEYVNSRGLAHIRNFYNHIELWLGISVISYYDKNKTIEENLKQNAITNFLESEEDKNILTKESKLFIVILNIINKSPKNLSDAMKVIFENTFSDEARFCLEMFTRAHHPESELLLNGWPSLSEVPKDSITSALTNLKLNELI